MIRLDGIILRCMATFSTRPILVHVWKKEPLECIPHAVAQEEYACARTTYHMSHRVAYACAEGTEMLKVSTEGPTRPKTILGVVQVEVPLEAQG